MSCCFTGKIPWLLTQKLVTANDLILMPLKSSLLPTSAKIMIVHLEEKSEITIWQASHLHPPWEAWKLRADSPNKIKKIWQELTFKICWNCCNQNCEDKHTFHSELLLLYTPSVVLCASIQGIKVVLDGFALSLPSPLQNCSFVRWYWSLA